MTTLFHLRNDMLEKCSSDECHLKHYENPSSAIIKLPEDLLLSKYKIKLFNKRINKKAGTTTHFQNERAYRELKIKSLLGEGFPIISFILEISPEDIQIQEILDNGVINVYSYFSHKKITMFIPTPERLSSIYKSCGVIPPSKLIIKSEINYRNGYNSIC